MPSIESAGVVPAGNDCLPGSSEDYQTVWYELKKRLRTSLEAVKNARSYL
jgi:hypothetical protein